LSQKWIAIPVEVLVLKLEGLEEPVLVRELPTLVEASLALGARH
jgi:hypothetical protein